MRERIDYEKSWKIYWSGSGFALVFILLDLLVRSVWLACIGGFALVVVVAQTFYFYRCPECGKRLPLKGGKNGAPVTQCPHCGRELGWSFGADL